MKRFALGFIAVALYTSSGHAEEIHNPIAIFSGLEKVMAITTNFEAKIGETVKFGNLFGGRFQVILVHNGSFHSLFINTFVMRDQIFNRPFPQF